MKENESGSARDGLASLAVVIDRQVSGPASWMFHFALLVGVALSIADLLGIKFEGLWGMSAPARLVTAGIVAQVVLLFVARTTPERIGMLWVVLIVLFISVCLIGITNFILERDNLLQIPDNDAAFIQVGTKVTLIAGTILWAIGCGFLRMVRHLAS